MGRTGGEGHAEVMSTPPNRRPILVGVDGSDGSRRAVHWAARLGARERRPILLLHAGAPLRVDVSGAATSPAVNEVLAHEHAGHHALVAAAARAAARLEPTLEVRTEVDPAGARAALLAHSRDAEVVVLGTRRTGLLRSAPIGRLTGALLHGSRCPVVVVRNPPERVAATGVVVGVDGTARSAPALRFAARMAAAWDEPLLVVHCYWPPSLLGEEPTQFGTSEEQRLVLAEQVAGLGVDHPELVVRTRLLQDFADRTLVREAASRRLLVIGHHRAGLLQEVVWGSVAPAVLRHSDGDVAVVPVVDLAADEPSADHPASART